MRRAQNRLRGRRHGRPHVLRSPLRMGKVWIAPISFGLGDLVVSLPAIQALIRGSRAEGDEVWLVARAPTQRLLAERITGLAGSVDEASFDPCREGGRFVDLRDHPLQRDFWWGSESVVRGC